MWVLCTMTNAPNNPPNMSTMNGVVLFELKAPYAPGLNEGTFRSGWDVPPDARYGPSDEPECQTSEDVTYIFDATFAIPTNKVELDVTTYQDMKEGTPIMSFDSKLASDANMFNELNTALQKINKKQNKLSVSEKKCLAELKEIALTFCKNIQACKIDYYENNGVFNETTVREVNDSKNRLITFVNKHQKLLCRIGTHLGEDKTYYRYLLNEVFNLNACEEAQCCCVQ